jgi:hypothetical protein
MAEALAFATEGKVKADIELQPLSSINQIFDRLEHGEVASRVVLDFAKTFERPEHIDVASCAILHRHPKRNVTDFSSTQKVNQAPWSWP